MNLPAGHIEIYRGPSPSGYADTRIVRRGGSLTLSAFPDVALAVIDLMG